jgi:hypothetical protein
MRSQFVKRKITGFPQANTYARASCVAMSATRARYVIIRIGIVWN